MTSDSQGQPLSVLILTPEYPPHIVGGLGTHVCELARGLARAGHRVHVVITELVLEPRVGDAMDEGFDVHLHYVPVIGKSRGTDTAARALEVVEEHGLPDIVHCHDYFFVPAAQRLRRAVGTTVVGTVHLLPGTVARWVGGYVPIELLERMFCTNVDRLIAVSGALRQLCHDVHGVPLDRIEVVHNGFDARDFLARPGDEKALAALRAEFCQAHEKLVLFAGRLCWQKGIDGFIEAAELVVGQRNDIRYVVAGAVQDGYEPTWNQLLERHSAVRPHLTQLGMIPRKRLASLYQVADLAVVPSLYEPFGYAAVEALAAGCPVVATDVGGLPEIFSYPDHPALVAVDTSSSPHRVDSAMLAAVQLDLLDHPEHARRQAEAGRQHVLTTFTVERMVAETIAVYRRAMAARGAPRRRPSVD